MERVWRVLMVVALASRVAASTGHAADLPVRSLAELSSSFESLVEQVAPSVVQVVVTAYTTIDQGDSKQTDLVMSRQRSLGSGVVVDAAGYILTNEHVVSGARRVQVVLLRSRNASNTSAWSQLADDGRTVDEKTIGTSRELDVALLKVDVAGLRPLPFGDYNAFRQDKLVFAFGSPEGFRNSVSMGLVRATARQPDPDTPVVYIQTDAAINRGNSGGPLVNAHSELVGINTIIISSSGGSEGLGFALPSVLAQMAYAKLRDYGHLHRGEIGVLSQTITPALAAGLRLPTDHGVILSDVIEGKPAAQAWLQIGDVIQTLDGIPVDNVLAFAMRMFGSDGTEHVKVGGMRGDRPFLVDMALVPRAQEVDRPTDFIDPDTSVVPYLGIVAVVVTPAVAELLPSLRADFGVVVAARAAQPAAVDVTLLPGDLIHSLNGAPVATPRS